MRCQVCGSENPPGMRFCGQCGAVQTPGAATEERRLVTVLFADVVGSTRLLGTTDSELARGQILSFFNIAQEEIRRHGGTLEKFIGDAVMAVFGLPATHEDDVERAVRTALSIRQRIRADVEAGRLPQLRMGINTGEVVANTRAAGVGDSLLTGEMVNIATRLQEHAEPGQIVVGESTYANTQWSFEYRRLPPFEVKHRSKRVVAYECLRSRAQPATPGRGLRGITSPLVGRAAELAAFLHCVDRLREGRGGILAAIGEAGIGKSRLAAEVRHQTEGDGLRWLEGRTLPFNQEVGYWPFLEIIRGAVGITPQDREPESWSKLEDVVNGLFAETTVEIVPYLGTLLGLPVAPEWEDRVKYLSGEAIARQIYRSCRLFFEKLAQQRPLVLLFEDLHGVDQSSAGLLEHLLPLVESAPLLLCGLARPDPETPAARVRDLSVRDHADRYTEIILRPLSPGDTVELARNLLGADDLPGRFRDVILSKTEGNPFFVEEIVRVLTEAKAVVPERGSRRWRISARIEDMSVPNTLRGVIMARVDRLDDDAKQALRTASVIGRTFSSRVLRAVGGNPGMLDQALATLQEHDFIRERWRDLEPEYSFTHALIHETVYDGILQQRRRDLHRRIGGAIEQYFAGHLDEFYSVLAFHYARAEEWEKAQEFLFKAGDQAAKVAADAEALGHYRRAVEAHAHVFGDRWEPLKRAALERKVGEALFRRGALEQAMEHFQRALGSLGSPFPDSRWGVQLEIMRQIVLQMAHRGLPMLFVKRGSDRARPAAEERTRLYEAMGWIDYFVSVDRVFLEGVLLLNVAERYDLRAALARGFMGMGFVCDLIPLHAVAGAYHHRATALAEQIQHPLALGLAYLGLAFHDLHARGRWEESLEYFRRSAMAYRQAGELRQWGASATMTAWVLRLKGDLAGSLVQSREIEQIGRDAADPQTQAWGLAMQGAVLLRTGRADEAMLRLQQSIDQFKAVPDHVWEMIATSLLGTCHLQQGRLREALDALEESNRLVAQHGLRAYDRTPPLIPLASAYVLAAERAEGGDRGKWLEKAYRACRAAVKQMKVDAEAQPSATRVQGTFHWLTGRQGAAYKWWERSLQAAERLGARYDLGMTCLEIGNRVGKREHLQRAEAIFAEIGARWDLERTRASLRTPG